MDIRSVRAGSFFCGGFVAATGFFTLLLADFERDLGSLTPTALPKTSTSAPALASLNGSVHGLVGLRASLLADRLARGEAAPPPTAAAEPEFASATPAQPEEEDDFALAEAEEPFDVAGDAKGLGAPKRRGGLTILQIGDSHTAADYFTGELRRLLQKRFGNGGPGYVDIGKPHPGVRTAAMNVSVGPGWTYSALQKSDDTARYHLSGFDAEAAHAHETLTFTAPEPISYDRIEVEVLTGPGRGDIDIYVDNQSPVRRSLASAERGRAVYRLPAERHAKGALHTLRIETVDNRPVTISSVGIFNRSHGVSYSNVGFPGATVDIVNKYDPAMLDEALKRLSPQLVVLAFGTNEGFNDDLDVARYRDRYLAVIQKIRESVPRAQIVMVGPPHANRVPAPCIKDAASAACKEQIQKATTVAMDEKTAEEEKPAATRDEKHAAHAQICPYPTPPRLDPVREAQRSLAKQENVAFWDWAAIMPKECGPHVWSKANPRLMAADHVHFTSEGYKVSASAFLHFLMPLINQLRRKQYAFSND